MATLFLDYEGGNDNYGGTSFALLASGTDGRITSTTFSAATASFPNDGSLIGQYLSIWNASIYAVYQITAWVSGTELTIAALSGGTALANQAVDRQYYIGGRWKTITSGATAVRTVPGDTIRLMASPEPTLVGNATWTGTPEFNGLTITSSTNATPIVVTKASHGLSDNDYILLTGHTTNTNANGIWQITYIDADTFSLDGSVGNGVGGATGGFRKINNAVVELAEAKTQLIAGCSQQEGAWTASANVTATVNTTDYKNHYGSASIAIAAGFTTGMAAYFPTASALDLSSYEQVSFWIKQTAGTIPADGAITLTLCSDAAGATPVDTISVPSCKILNYWMPVTVDTGSALGASIQSVALNVATDNGAQTFLIGEIIACKPSADADSLSLTSLIGKNTAGETFVGIQSINGTRVVLDCHTNHIPTSYSSKLPGYSTVAGTTETVATYKRETVKLNPAAGTTTATDTTQVKSGTVAAYINMTGGWDRTAMTTQSGETWWDGQNGCGVGLYVSGANNYIHHDKMNFCRFYTGMQTNQGSYGFGCTSGTIHVNNCTGYGFNFDSGENHYGTFVAKANEYGANFSCIKGTIETFTVGDNNTLGLIIQADTRVKTFIGTNCSVAYSYSLLNFNRTGSIVDNATIRFAKTAAIYREASYGWGDNVVRNLSIQDCPQVIYSSTVRNSYIHVHKYGNTADDHRSYSYMGTIVTDATMAHGTAAYGWKFSPTTTNCVSDWPLKMKVGRIALAANVTKTIGYWMRRDNTGLTMKLVCKGGQIAGIAADVTSSMTAAIDTWEQVSITLTPTETGVVELEAHAYGGATYNGWVSKMEIA